MTNADKIRNMTNWELAEFIYNVSNGATEQRRLALAVKSVQSASIQTDIVYI